MNFFLIKTKWFFFNERNCKQCFDETDFLTGELIVNKILIVSMFSIIIIILTGYHTCKKTNTSHMY